MKIYYIASFTKLWDEECIAQALENIGCEVVRKEQNRFTNKEFLEDIELNQPDLVLFAKLLTKEDGNQLIKAVKQMGITTVSWTFDLYCGYYRESDIKVKPFFRADYVFTTDGGNQEKFKQYGVNHYCLRQGIYSPQAVIGKKKPEYRNDVIFVGTHNPQYPFRQQLASFLDKNFDFRWHGREHPDTIRGLELNNLYASAKIVVGDSVPSPYYWSNRVYETIGRGGFLLFPETPGIKDEIPMIQTFKQGDLNDLKKEIEFWLERDSERVRIQLEAFEFIRHNYTYEKRCKTILDTIYGGMSE